jgi:hypothetical protein
MSWIAAGSCQDADNFVISFPQELEVKMKAVLLGACFPSDFMKINDLKSQILLPHFLPLMDYENPWV